MSERKNGAVKKKVCNQSFSQEAGCLLTKLQDSLLEVIRQLTEQGEVEWYDDGNGGKDAVIKIAVFEYEDADERGEVVRERAPVVGLVCSSHREVRESEDPEGINEMAEIIWCSESEVAKNLHDLVQGIDRKESQND